MEEKIYVVDTSVVIERLVSQFIKSKKISGKIIVPRAVMAELENQANTGQEIGFLGLEELQSLQKIAKEGKIELTFLGERPSLYQISGAKTGGEIDALIRDIAYNEGAILITADKIQSESAKALGVEVMYVHHKELTERLEIEKYFDETTMSVHLKEECLPKAKKGRPGEWRLFDVDTKELSQHNVQEIAKEIVERSRIEPNAFIEISRPGSTIVQYKNYRIVISKPPVSDGWEITAVRPIKILKIEDYNLPEKISERVKKKARGVVIAGTTGSGKCLEINTPIYSKELGKVKVKSILKNYDFSKKNNQYIPKENISLLGVNKDGKITSSKIKRIVLRNENLITTIKTTSGKIIEATKEHLFLVFNGKEGIKWKPLKEIKGGDLMATPDRLEFLESQQELNILKKLNQETVYALCKINYILPIYMKYKIFSKERKLLEYILKKDLKTFTLKDIKILSKSRGGTVIRVLIKENIIERLARCKFRIKCREYNFNGKFWLSLKDINSKYLVGRIDKSKVLYLKNTGKNSRESIIIKPVWNTSVELMKILAYLNSEGITKFGISNTSKEILDDFFDSMYKVFGINKSAFKIHNHNYYIDNGGIFHTFFKDLLNYDYKLKQKSSKIEFPKFFLNLSLREKKSYLRAYFDAESSVDKKCIELLSASIKSINQINNLLLNFGIHSRISKKTSYARNSPNPKIKDYYRLTISGRDNLIKFKEEIGFLLNYKMENLKFIIKDEGVTNVGALPAYNILKEIKDLLNGFSFDLYSNSCYSKNQLSKILSIIYKRYIEQLGIIEKTNDLMGALVYLGNWRYHISEFKENLDNEKLTVSKFSQRNNFDRECLTNWVNLKSQPRINSLCKLASKEQSFYFMPYVNIIKDFDNDFKEVLNTFNITNEELKQYTQLSPQNLSYLRNNSFLATKPDNLTRISSLLYKRLLNLDKAEELISKIYFLAKSDIFWDKVKSIENKKGSFEVFDVEIEDSHNFIAGDNPFIAHNSTFAQSLGEYYSSNNFVTKTVESPRSLILSKEITQYSKNLATSEEIHDILFLSRPDYIIFDEMRNTPDFELYTDLRLGGSNVLGVLHAATPIDAVQRFISRMDVGMIPSILDTLIFIENGNIGKIMTVTMMVKVPSGMTEADLARPVIEVRDYMTNKLEFEIYSYGEETVVIPVDEEFMQQDPTKVLAAKQLERELREFASDVKVKIISGNKAEVYIPEYEIAKFIGKEGKNINMIEKKVGFGLTVKELTEEHETESSRTPIHYKIEESKKALIFRLPLEHSGKTAEVYVDNHFLLAYTVGKKAEIKINKKSKLGQELLNDLNKSRNVEVRI